MERWITVKELQEIAEIGETKAGQIIKKINDEITNSNGIVAKPGRAPRSIVLNKLRIEEENNKIE